MSESLLSNDDNYIARFLSSLCSCSRASNIFGDLGLIFFDLLNVKVFLCSIELS